MRWAVAYALERLFVLALIALLFVCVFHGAEGAPTPTSTKSIAGWALTR